MHRINSILTLLIVFVLAASLTGSASAAPVPIAKWTVMVYISGDNNLEDYVVKDLELELAPTPHVGILCQIRRKFFARAA